MSTGKKLAAMIRAPESDWTIKDLISIADTYGILHEIRRNAGSHYTFAGADSGQKIIIPSISGRTVGAVYIQQFCNFVFSLSAQAIEDCRSAIKKDKPARERLNRMLAMRQPAQIG